MKTFLLPTDFSDAATHSVKYGYNLASQVKANILLCNAVLAPSESPQVGLLVWPVEETAILIKDSTDKLKQLLTFLVHSVNRSGFKPSVLIINEPGTVEHIINEIIENQPIDVIVIGTHETGVLDTLLLGNEARSLIDDATRPLLLVPPSAIIGRVKKIAFATDCKDLKRDMGCIYTLITLARPLNAEILLTHIYDGQIQSSEFKQSLENMNELLEKADYPNIHFKTFENASTESGLEWLCQHGQVDILAMVHRSHTFIDSLFRGSQTQKMAGHLPIPLLVFPAQSKAL